VNWGQHILIFGLRVYQRVLSPVIATLAGPSGRCRFEPSCSHYAVEAVQLHGAVKGSALAVGRVCRCNPWGGCGHDPVPVPTHTPNLNYRLQKGITSMIKIRSKNKDNAEPLPVVAAISGGRS
jgi:putative membrane protein insertion efficiency factor